MTLAGVFGTGISGDDFVGIVVAVFITAYLFFALLKPEKL